MAWEQVGLRDDALQTSVFIDHERHFHPPLLEQIERVEHRRRFGYGDRLTQRRREIERAVAQTKIEDIFLADDARDLID